MSDLATLADLTSLRELAERSRPVVLAREQVLPVSAALASLLPGGSLQRGTTVGVGGEAASTLALALVAEASQAGSWVAVVGLAELGLSAAAERGVALERLVLVRDVELASSGGSSWASVVAALVGAFDLVVVAPTAKVRAADARRLAARSRERGSVLIMVESPTHRSGVSALEADLWLRSSNGEWLGLGLGHGHLRARRVQVEASGRRRASRPRRATLWLPDEHGQVTVAEPLGEAGVVAPVVPFSRVERQAG